VACLLLFLGVVGAGLARLPAELPAPAEPGPEGPEASQRLFPRFRLNETVHAVSTSALPADERLTLATAQGILNRRVARVFVDSGTAWDAEMLSLLEKAGAAVRRTDLKPVLIDHASELNGTVVYDPSRPATLNLATTLAASCGCPVASPRLAEALAQLGLAPAIDLRSDPRGAGEPREIYERALSALPAGQPRTATIIAPDEWRSRDCSTALSSFVFFYPQGPLASPGDVEAMESMMARLPRGIPVLGWFPTPTKAEENFAIQSISRHGKHSIGSGDIPNLSILAALPTSSPLRHPWWTGQAPALERGSIYLAFAVPDGDHLGFVQGRMFELWRNRSEARGLPLGWTLPAALAEIAPGVMEYFYDRSTDDSFIAAPSGAGYAYPDFLPPTELDRFLARTRHLMDLADLDTLWLLNSFTAYEVPYSERVLSAYAAIKPRGLILDYADAPGARAEWMQPGGGSGAPVVRAYHLWSTVDNLIAKVQAHADARADGTSFALVTLYPWTHRLADLPVVADRLESLFPGRVRIVSPPALLDLVAEQALAAGMEDAAAPGALASLSPWTYQSSKSHLDAARTALAAGERRTAATQAHLAAQAVRRAEVEGSLVLMSLVGVGCVGVIVVRWRALRNAVGSSRAIPPAAGWADPLAMRLLFCSVVLLFVVSLAYEAQRYFWDYWAVIGAILASPFAVPLERRLRRRSGSKRTVLAMASIFILSAVALTWHTAAFIPLAVGFAGTAGSLLEARDRKEGARRAIGAPVFGGAVMLSLASVVAVPAVAGAVLVVAGAVVVLLLASQCASIIVPPPASSSKRGPADRLTTTSAAVVCFSLLPVVAVSSGSLALSASLDPATLAAGAAAAGALAVPLGLALHSVLGPKRVPLPLLLCLASSGTLVCTALQGPGVIVLATFSLAFSFAALVALLERSPEIDRRSLAMKVTAMLTLGYLLARLPPISWSLYGVPLPAALEYALYTPLLIAFVLGLVIAVRSALPSRLLRSSAG
jgi:hypothetical protein